MASKTLQTKINEMYQTILGRPATPQEITHEHDRVLEGNPQADVVLARLQNVLADLMAHRQTMQTDTMQGNQGDKKAQLAQAIQ